MWKRGLLLSLLSLMILSSLEPTRTPPTNTAVVCPSVSVSECVCFSVNKIVLLWRCLFVYL